MFTAKDFNLRLRRWLELLKDYDMSVHYNPGKANVVVDALSKLPMGCVTNVVYDKKDLIKEIQWLARFGV